MYLYGKLHSIYGSTLPKIRIALKKVVRNWISPKKVPEDICLSPPGVELGGSKDWQVQNIILKGNNELHSI